MLPGLITFALVDALWLRVRVGFGASLGEIVMDSILYTLSLTCQEEIYHSSV